MRHIRPPARLFGAHLISRLSHPSVTLSVCLGIPPLCLVALCLYAPRRARARPTLPVQPIPAEHIVPAAAPTLFAAGLFTRVAPTRPAGALPRAQETLLDSPLIRVALSRCAVSRVILNAEPGARLFGPDGREAAAGMGPWTITMTPTGARAEDASGHLLGTAASGTCWRLQSDDADTILGIAPGGGAARRYRGNLEVGVAGNRLYAVNEVSLESYLRGVIPCEIGGSAPGEAMKAQAVASRTYALRCLLHNRDRETAGRADVQDTTDSQVYNGVDAETPDADAAVQATSGLILTIDGQPILAQFCADCGGVTTPGNGLNDCPRSVDDSEAHANMSRRSDWSLHVTLPQLAEALEKKQPELRSLGTLTAVDVLDKDVSGRVRHLRLTWRKLPKLPPQTAPVPADAPITLAGDTPLQSPGRGEQRPSIDGRSNANAGRSKQRPYGGDTQAETPPAPNQPHDGDTAKPAAPPTEDPNADPSLLPPLPIAPLPSPQEKKPQKPALPPLPPPVYREIAGNTLRVLLGVNTFRSTLFTVHKLPDGEFAFDGRGWGHGRGMCQVGAMALASPPLSRDFRSILRHYYAGATLSHLTCVEPEGEFTVTAVAADSRADHAALHDRKQSPHPSGASAAGPRLARSASRRQAPEGVNGR